MAEEMWRSHSGSPADSPMGHLPQTGSMGMIGSAPMVSPQIPAYPVMPMQHAAPGYSMPSGYPSAPQPPMQQYYPQPAMGGPAEMLSSVTSNPMAQMGIQYGQQLVTSSFAKYLPGAAALWNTLRYYFDVNNGYVQSKLRRLLFPFAAVRWTRDTVQRPDPAAVGGGGPVPSGSSFAPPRHDENAPDLYVPTMAFVTLMVMTGLLKGTRMRFTPEVLAQVASSSMVTLILEVALVYGGMYGLGIGERSLFDLIAYSGYKLVGVVVSLLAGLLLGSGAYWLALIYTSIAMAYFIVQSLQPLARPDRFVDMSGGPLDAGSMAPGAPASGAAARQRNYFIFAVGALQPVLMWWLGASGDL